MKPFYLFSTGILIIYFGDELQAFEGHHLNFYQSAQIFYQI